jgi:predicted helicase
MPKPLATLSHLDLYGRRNEKYDTLETLSVQDAKWTTLDPVEPYYFFVPKDFWGQDEYEKGFKMDELFTVTNSWIESKNDEVTMRLSRNEAEKLFDDISAFTTEEIRNKYKISDTENWKLWKSLEGIRNGKHLNIRSVSYRPFDTRYTILTIESWWFLWRPRIPVSRSLIKPNFAIVTERNNPSDPQYFFISNSPVDSHLLWTAHCKWFCFPLYLYSDSENLENQTRTPNLDETIWSAINEIVGDTSSQELWSAGTTPEQILDYIYAVLHSPSYREKYREFLKIDFPRVPYPRDRESFLALVALGGELRSLHLLESSKVEDFITSYPVAGDNVVEKVEFREPPSWRGNGNIAGTQGDLWSDTEKINPPSSQSSDTSFKKEAIGKVYINATQYFGGVPESVWTHPIGGYMPAQKWLKDRKGRTLTNDDIMHYQRMIVALSETARVMGEVDRVIEV